MLSAETRTNRVAIIGRPNVGKSTLFNILTDTRKAIVKNQPGVTRDIQVEPAEWQGMEFEVMDTGGITDASDIFSKKIKEQVQEVIHNVSCIVMIVDARAGLVPEDKDVFLTAKETNKPILIVVNKADQPHEEENVKAEFYTYGVDVMACSFEQRRGVSDVLDWIISNFTETDTTVREGLTIAIIGRPNAGKSSLTNKLLNENRMMVSDIAGTTIDSIDSELVYNDRKYILIDTAGLRRKSRRDELEVIATFKSNDSIRRADLVLLMIDGVEGVTDQDAKIVEYIILQHKAVILVANKLDLGEEEIPEFRKQFLSQLEFKFHFFTDIPVAFISAKNGTGIKKLFQKIEELEDKLHTKISTSKLNKFFTNTIRQAPAPVYNNHDVKFYYLTQTQQVPPSFIAFANFPGGVNTAYRRFIAKRLKAEFDLEGVPIRIFAMKSGGKKMEKVTKKIEEELSVEQQTEVF